MSQSIGGQMPLRFDALHRLFAFVTVEDVEFRMGRIVHSGAIYAHETERHYVTHRWRGGVPPQKHPAWHLFGEEPSNAHCLMMREHLYETTGYLEIHTRDELIDAMKVLDDRWFEACALWLEVEYCWPAFAGMVK